MKSRKITAIFLTLTILMSCYLSSFSLVSATSSATLSVSSASDKKGAEVSVSVDITANSTVAAATFILKYDATALEATSAAAGVAITSETGGISDINIDNTVGSVTLTYINPNGLNASGSVMNITFKIKSTASSSTIPLDLQVPEFVDNTYQPIANTVTDGTVTITYTPGNINGDGMVDLKDVTSLSRHLAGWEVPVVNEALNVNGDSSIDLKDVTILSRYLAGWDVEIK